jgi:hypothetical protein
MKLMSIGSPMVGVELPETDREADSELHYLLQPVGLYLKPALILPIGRCGYGLQWPWLPTMTDCQSWLLLETSLDCSKAGLLMAVVGLCAW